MNNKAKRLCALTLSVILLFGVLSAAFAQDDSPLAENLEFETYRGVSFGARLSATALEGEIADFEVVTQPRKGKLTLESDGSFVYTPFEGKKGRDYFGYKAVDSEGRRSQEATVIIKLIKCRNGVSYEDMKGSASEYAAVCLAECGAFIGKCVGGRYYFEPSAKVTRGEFLSLCLCMSGRSLLSGVVSTGFSDDAEIPEYYKPYVATAVMDGIISGKPGSGECVFDASECITGQEAAVILNNTLSLSDVSHIALPDELPEWALQSAANLIACGIIDDAYNSSELITRSECARMLTASMAYFENR